MLSYSTQAPLAPQSVLQNRHVESIPAPKIKGGGMNPVKHSHQKASMNHLTSLINAKEIIMGAASNAKPNTTQ